MYKHALTTLAILLTLMVYSQQDIRERVYLHLSSHEVISGETLYYSAYCVSNLTGQTADLSKILYVEIIGEDGVVHKIKMALKDGRGHGDFFIPSTIKSGRYQIVAYTRWMKNFNDYFQAPLIIINPFEQVSAGLPKKEEISMQFFPSGGKLITEVPNTVAFKIELAPFDSGGHFKGKIISDSGEKVADFSHDRLGIGQFEITPTNGEKYQAILEGSSGDFHFFEIPESRESGTSLIFKETKKTIEIGIHTYPETESDGYLVFKIGSKVELKPVLLNSTHILLKSEITDDVISIQVLDQNERLITERIYVKDSILPSVASRQSSQVYSVRQKVVTEHKLNPGTYSVSVRKKNLLTSYHSYASASKLKTLLSTDIVDPNEYLIASAKFSANTLILTRSEENSREVGSTSDSITLLPEFREEILDGFLLDEKNVAVKNKLVTLSIPESPPQFRAATTSENGSFSISFQSSVKDIDAYLSTANMGSSYKIIRTYPFMDQPPAFDYSLPLLDSIKITKVIEKSIRSQIQNAYYSPKDFAIPENDWLPQIPFDFEYVLDNYVRFQTIRETFKEYVVTASIRDTRTDMFKAYTPKSNDFESYPPLILLDGIPVSADEILNFSPYKIEKIGILNNRFFVGNLISDGVIAFQTKEDQLSKFQLGSNYQRAQIMGLNNESKFNAVQYSNPQTSKRADQRDLLFWNPQLNISGDTPTEITFFTSDVIGEFEFVIEGFSLSGQPISISESFEVQGSLGSN